MFTTENKIRKDIVTSEAEDVFQIRYISDEEVGILTTPSEKHYFILDSGEYWYDLIQEKYPPKKKCQCKNDSFRVWFQYIPRIGTEDYRTVELVSCCTACGKERIFAQVPIQYGPSAQLFHQPITHCPQPKIKCKTYSVGGYWSEESFGKLLDFLSQKCQKIYCWYWKTAPKRREVTPLAPEELKRLLLEEKARYLAVYFSLDPLEAEFARMPSDERGVIIQRNIWRKKNLVLLHGPFHVMGKGAFYSMEFCSEYIGPEGAVKEKDPAFSQLVKELLAYSKAYLK